MTGKFQISTTEAREKSGRAKAVTQRAENRLRIEGEYVTHRQIAERIGRNQEFVGRRLRELRGASGPITWARLTA